jgi:hypothetical protein
MVFGMLRKYDKLCLLFAICENSKILSFDVVQNVYNPLSFIRLDLWLMTRYCKSYLFIFLFNGFHFNIT